MLADLINYRPQTVEFVLDDKATEMFSEITTVCNGTKTSLEALKVFREKFNCLFPEGELATRKYDAYEVSMIREEYCLKEENEAPKRKQELSETLDKIKAMKKRQRKHTTLSCLKLQIWQHE